MRAEAAARALHVQNRGMEDGDDPLALVISLLRIAETVADPLPLVAAARSLLEELAPRWAEAGPKPLSRREWG